MRMILLYLAAVGAAIWAIGKGSEKKGYPGGSDEQAWNDSLMLDQMWQAPPAQPKKHNNTWPAPRAEERQG